MKRAIIIGASSGMGRALAQILIRNGYSVAVTGRRKEILDQLASDYDGKIIPVAFDATDGNLETHLEAIVKQTGGMDLFVFCAGTGEINQNLEYNTEQMTNKLNVDAFTQAMDFAYSYFAERGGGHIAAVTSVMGLRGSAAAPAYAASKAYQINYLEGLRQRACKERSGVEITDLRPGSVDTDMMKGEGHFWIAQPEEAALTMVNAIDRKKQVAYITPRWKIIGILLKMIPRGIYKKM